MLIGYENTLFLCVFYCSRDKLGKDFLNGGFYLWTIKLCPTATCKWEYCISGAISVVLLPIWREHNNYYLHIQPLNSKGCQLSSFDKIAFYLWIILWSANWNAEVLNGFLKVQILCRNRRSSNPEVLHSSASYKTAERVCTLHAREQINAKRKSLTYLQTWRSCLASNNCPVKLMEQLVLGVKFKDRTIHRRGL